MTQFVAKMKRRADVEQRDFADNSANRAKDLIRQAAEEYKPYGSKHAETFVFSFFSTNDLITGKAGVDLATFKVLAKDSSGKEFELSPEIRNQFLEVCKDRLLELMGAKKMVSKTKTTEETLDELSSIGVNNDVISDFKKSEGLNG